MSEISEMNGMSMTVDIIPRPTRHGRLKNEGIHWVVEEKKFSTGGVVYINTIQYSINTPFSV